jgi:zinc transporter ZupT
MIMEVKRSSNVKTAVSVAVPFVLLAVMIGYVFGPGSELIDYGILLPDISIEKIEFVDSEIIATVRNTGPISVNIVMADINDRIYPAAIEPDKHLERFQSAIVRIPFEWNEGEPYAVGLTVDDGTRFEKRVDVAAPSIQPTVEMIAYFAVIGTYVGIIPVLIGLLWFPFIAKLSRNKYKFFLALTVGLLLFLGISATEEAIKISAENLSDVFNGALLVVTVAIVSFLALNYAGEKLKERAGASKLAGPIAIALMIAIGIGLHNFGEGLAIGAAIVLGEAALGAFLIVGFAIHNTTEGFAIAAPMARTKLMIGRLAAMGMIAGVPAIFGAWVGGFVYSPFAAVIFLAIGAGAIFQVIVLIMKWIQNEEGKLSNGSVLAGIAVGMMIMYVTSILVA